MSVVIEMFWMHGWGAAQAGGVVVPTDALFEQVRARAMFEDPATMANLFGGGTALFEDAATTTVVENPRTDAALT